MELDKNRTNGTEMVEAIQKEAQTNPVFGQVCEKLATRIRNRDHLTVGALKLAMDKDQQTYPRHEYVAIVRFLAKIGLGKLETDNKGNVIGLTKIPISLQQIGQVAKSGELKLSPPPPAQPSIMDCPTGLAISFRGNQVMFPGPVIEASKLGQFIIEFHKLAKAFGGIKDADTLANAVRQ